MDVAYEVNGTTKINRQSGAKTLRAKASLWKGVVLHHAGDVLHKSSESGAMNLGNIVGTIAWVTVETLLYEGVLHTKLRPKCEKNLSKSLFALGITKEAADALAKQPIFLSCNFGERKPASPADDGDDSDDEDESEAEEYADESALNTGTDLLCPGPTLRQAQSHTESIRASQRGKPATCSKKGLGDGGSGQP